MAAVANQDWDASVKSLTAFPQVLANMDAHLDWTQKLGDAMLGQQQDVADSVQRLRAEAAAAGNLASNSQQTVSYQGSGDDRMIEIEPVNPAMIYVPYYNPTWAYGSWPYAAYPPDYYPPPPIYGYGAPLASGIMFGIGLAASSAIFGGWNWRRGNSYVNVNVDRAVHIDRTFNAATVNNGQWQHNADHRKGVAYRDPAVSQQFGQGGPGVDQRQQYRGRTANAPATQPAQATARPAVAQQPGARPAAPQQVNPVPQRATAQPATRPPAPAQPAAARPTPVQPSAVPRPAAQPLPQVQTRAPTTTTPTAPRGAALSGIDRGQQVNHEAARGRAQQTRAAAPAAAARSRRRGRRPAMSPAILRRGLLALALASLAVAAGLACEAAAQQPLRKRRPWPLRSPLPRPASCRALPAPRRRRTRSPKPCARRRHRRCRRSWARAGATSCRAAARTKTRRAPSTSAGMG